MSAPESPPERSASWAEDPAPVAGPVAAPAAAPDPAAVVRATLGAAYAGDLGALDGHPGVGALTAALAKVRAAFPDFAAEFEQQVVEGERVATHWTLRGTHRGEFFGVAPTGKAVRFQNVCIARVVGGRIVQFNSEVGWLSVLLQLGALPMPAQSPPSEGA